MAQSHYIVGYRQASSRGNPPFPYRTKIAAQLILTLMALLILPDTVNAAEYIGRNECKGCHAEQNERWQGSHHDLAMQEATPETVLGDFGNTEFEQFGVVSTFHRKDDMFMVRTDGTDGILHDFPIQYTLGVYPLQQYLIEFPGGRLQALDIAWDSRSKEAGGQRWFHLHPAEKIAHDDILHWTGPNLNWNYMCADCHSTNLKKKFDQNSAEYHTSWSVLDVSCEACHGPGSEHEKWAKAAAASGKYDRADMGLTVSLNERDGVRWVIDEKTGKPRRSQPNQARAEIQVCARCHSRRSQLTDDFTPGQPFLDGYRPALLSEGLYFPDGQIQDEVYVWGSFRQSRMYHAGVTCSDCHEPHAAGRKSPGKEVCNQCHLAARYARKEHHFHATDSAGADCIECHMPATTFMGVDARHDHSFRIPRPDWSVKLGTPNACNNCHKERSAGWALKKLTEWYGKQPEGFQRFAPALAAARSGLPTARQSLMQLAQDTKESGIARATAFSELGHPTDRRSMLLLQQGLNADDPLLRMGALIALEAAPLQQRILALPLVWDDLRAVRIEAAKLMAGYPRDRLKPEQIQVLEKALQEYIDTQQFSAERPESQLNLANLYSNLQQYEKAESAYRRARHLQPQFVPAYVNFAQLLSNREREQEAEQLLAGGIEKIPDSATLHHALGLSLVRQKKLDAALQSLARASELAPDDGRYAYVYAVALHSTGNTTRALRVLEQTQAKHPTDLNILFALVTFNRDAGDREAASLYARKLQAIMPDDPAIEQLIQELQNR